MNLTPKQLAIVQFIIDYRDRKGIAPTLAEIADALGVSKITVYEHIAQLDKKGALTKQKYQSRSLNVSPQLEADLKKRRTQRQDAGLSLPLLGRIAAGQPIEAIETPEELDLTDVLKRGRQTYVLKVRGSSMIDEGIRDGDFVIVEARTFAHNGEMVVAIVGDNEATLKRYFRENNRVRLQPANADLKPLFVDRCEVRGVVVGVLRRY